MCLPIAAFSQVPFELGSIKVDSIYMRQSSDWWDEVSTSTTLSGATNSQLPTALAVRTFVMDTVPEMIADSIAAIDFTTTALQDSIDNHTDTLQLHNTRLKAMELIDHTHSNKATLDATTASFTTALNSTISNHTQYIADLNDSISVHQDTLQSHNTRLLSIAGDVAVHDDSITSYDTRITELETVGIGGGLEIDLDECATCDTFVVATGATLAYRVGSVIGTDTTHFNDSIYLDYAVGSQEQWLGLTTTGGVFADSLTDASFMLAQQILPIEQYLNDLHNGELLWQYMGKDGNVHTIPGLPKRPTDAANALMGGIERSYRYILVLQGRVDALEKEVEDLKASYDFRLRAIEAELNKKTVNVKLK